MAAASHFHIKWIELSNVDWERFETELDATERAMELVKPDETFSIEPFENDNCPHCGDIMRKRFA
jgi:hypothetical protein